ncbi:hypothetical protein NKH54_13975 [Mesorhizobium sp. M1004]|uniref:hypothetical protein n=1 Tax=Mesorhizobium sp. M1004 TaxID=2957046 RepID=UPI00333A2E45
MKVLSSASIKTFGDTAPGEFVAFGRGSRNLGLVLKEQLGGRLIGMVTHDEEPHPQIVSAGQNNECMSFGSDWAIEPVHGDQSFPTLHTTLHSHIAGLLALTKQGWLMSFATTPPNRGRFPMQWWSLIDQKLVDVESAALFNSWKIWASPDDRERGAQELYSYTAKALPRD